LIERIVNKCNLALNKPGWCCPCAWLAELFTVDLQSLSDEKEASFSVNY
jgi:hypothetical protein